VHLKFVNEFKNVAQLFPMERARDVSYSWIDRMRQDFACEARKPDFKMFHQNHAARCPGIFGLVRHGWVMRTWSDIVISTTGDGVSFEWRTPHRWEPPAVDFMRDDMFARFHENWPKDSLRHALKYNSGWRVEVPKGFYLLEMPIPYQDDSRFDVFPGVFSRDYGWAAMNPFFRWNVKEGSELIPAGTPIAQYILVPREEYSFSCETYDPKVHDRTQWVDWLKKTKFVNDMGRLKKIFGD